MDERQAEETVLAVEQTWEIDLGEARNMWSQAMLPYDSLTTASAILKLRERQRERPTIADLRKVISEIDVAQTASSLPPKRDPKGWEDKKEEKGPPEWTHIWFWLRFSQRDYRRLPDQDVYGAVAGTEYEEMTKAQYAEVREKWVSAGSPKVSVEKLNAVLTGSLPEKLST